MKTPHFLLTVTTLLGAASLATASAKDIPLASCPAPVQETIRSHAGSGKIDDIKMVSVDGASQYVADIDFPGEHDLKIHVSTTGALLKLRREIALTDAPASVRDAAARLVPQGARIDEVHKTTADGKVTYEVEIDRPNTRDLKLVMSESGEIVSQREDR